MFVHRAGSLMLLATSCLVAQTQAPAPAVPSPNRPTLFVVGDLPFASMEAVFDPENILLVDSSAKGQTTRTYLNSGKWDELRAQMKSGDFVIIGFKPTTDAGVAKLSTDPGAAATLTLKAEDGATFDYMDPDTHKVERIHNYNWYLRKFIADSISRGASPLLCYPPVPPDPNNRFPNNPYLAYPAWTIKAIASERATPYVNLTTQPFRRALEAVKPNPLAPYLSKPAP